MPAALKTTQSGLEIASEMADLPGVIQLKNKGKMQRLQHQYKIVIEVKRCYQFTSARNQEFPDQIVGSEDMNNNAHEQ